MDTIRLAMYNGQQLIDYFDVSLDDDIEKHMRWFIDAVSDEGANRVRISQKNDDGKLINQWISKTDKYFDQFMENVIEELLEERLVYELYGDNE